MLFLNTLNTMRKTRIYEGVKKALQKKKRKKKKSIAANHLVVPWSTDNTGVDKQSEWHVGNGKRWPSPCAFRKGSSIKRWTSWVGYVVALWMEELRGSTPPLLLSIVKRLGELHSCFVCWLLSRSSVVGKPVRNWCLLSTFLQALIKKPTTYLSVYLTCESKMNLMWNCRCKLELNKPLNLL